VHWSVCAGACAAAGCCRSTPSSAAAASIHALTRLLPLAEALANVLDQRLGGGGDVRVETSRFRELRYGVLVALHRVVGDSQVEVRLRVVRVGRYGAAEVIQG